MNGHTNPGHPYHASMCTGSWHLFVRHSIHTFHAVVALNMRIALWQLRDPSLQSHVVRITQRLAQTLAVGEVLVYCSGRQLGRLWRPRCHQYLYCCTLTVSAVIANMACEAVSGYSSRFKRMRTGARLQEQGVINESHMD